MSGRQLTIYDEIRRKELARYATEEVETIGPVKAADNPRCPKCRGLLSPGGWCANCDPPAQESFK